MHLVGRHTMARLYGAEGISARYVVSRPRAQWPATMRRYAAEDWAITPDGLAVPAIAGGAGWSSITQSPPIHLGNISTSATQTAIALNTNYTYNSAGNAVATRVTPRANKTLAAVYYFMTAHTGTPEVQIDLHTDGSSKPAASPTALGNSTPGGTGWKSLGSLSNALTAGTKYWVVISDNDGSTDGTATVLRSVAGAGGVERKTSVGFSTTDGWASVVTTSSTGAAVVLAYSDSTATGWPITASAAPASSTNRRGWHLSTGLTESIKVLGLGTFATTVTTGSGVEAYEGTTVPGGSTTASGTTAIHRTDAAGSLAGFLFSSVYTPTKATALRFVFTFSGASTAISKLQIGSGADATLRSAMWGGGANYYALANGTTDWTNDDQDAYPLSAYIIIEDQVAIATGGGVIGGPNKRAGMQ